MEELEELDSDEVDELDEIDMISESSRSKEKCDDNLSTMKNIYKNIQSNIKEDEYYCVDYGDQFYIGRVLSVHKKSVSMKFLRKYPDGDKWPSQDDIDRVEVQHIFFSPVIISGTTTFPSA